jgi:hypothetical protein
LTEGPIIPGLRLLEKSQIECREHHDNADVRYQPFPYMMPEEQQVYTNDNCNHYHSVKHAKHVPCHVDLPFKYSDSRLFIADTIMVDDGDDEDS